MICSALKVMKSKLTSLDKFKERHNKSNCVWILKVIKAIKFQFEGQRHILLSLDDDRTTL